MYIIFEDVINCFLFLFFSGRGRHTRLQGDWSPDVCSSDLGPMHAADGAGDMASLPLTKLVHEGVIVDISDVVDDWSIITPKHITDRMEVKRGDIVILHTGYHRYYEGKPQQDLTRYF